MTTIRPYFEGAWLTWTKIVNWACACPQNPKGAGVRLPTYCAYCACPIPEAGHTKGGVTGWTLFLTFCINPHVIAPLASRGTQSSMEVPVWTALKCSLLNVVCLIACACHCLSTLSLFFEWPTSTQIFHGGLKDRAPDS